MGYLVDRVSPRKLTFIGAVLAAASLAVCFLAPSLTFITVIFGGIGGKNSCECTQQVALKWAKFGRVQLY